MYLSALIQFNEAHLIAYNLRFIVHTTCIQLISFYTDEHSVYNSSGTQVGVTNLGQHCYEFTNQVDVWPGDLDNNKVVNPTDILKIGN